MTFHYDDITGRRFGRLTAIVYVGKNKHNRALWKCRCDCGSIKIVMVRHLKTSRIVSCGCYRVEQVKKAHMKHGLSRTRLYGAYQTRKRREFSKQVDSFWSATLEFLLFKIFPACVLCGSTLNLEIDHVHPISRGGGLRPGNVVILCRHCNRSKSNKVLVDLPWPSSLKILQSAEQFYFACLKEGLWLSV